MAVQNAMQLIDKQLASISLGLIGSKTFMKHLHEQLGHAENTALKLFTVKKLIIIGSSPTYIWKLKCILCEALAQRVPSNAVVVVWQQKVFFSLYFILNYLS